MSASVFRNVSLVLSLVDTYVVIYFFLLNITLEYKVVKTQENLMPLVVSVVEE